jgi:CHAT domain-containing protein
VLPQRAQLFCPAVLPVDTLRSARALGNLHFRRGNWQLALNEGYTIAITAVEQTRTWATDDKRRQELIENAIGVYDNALQCYINLKQYQEAILLTERARSRHLVDLMASNDAYKSGNIPADVLTYLEQYEDLQQRINAERQRQQDGETKALSLSTKRAESLDSLKITRAEIQHLYTEKARIWQQLRQLDPVLAGQLEVNPLDLDTLRQLIDRPTTALLSFYSTNDHTYIFVLRQDGIDLHTCTDQGYGTLQTWVRDQWLEQYDTQNNARFNQWRTNMPARLQDLAHRLQLNHLLEQHLQGIDELILIPHIYLHVIPFAALPLPDHSSNEKNNKPQYLGDAFRLRIVPSAQVLHYCQQRPSLPHLESLGLVEDASDDLVCARYECDVIDQLQPAPTRYRLQGSAQATIAAYRQLLQEQRVHALHSSHHASSVLGVPLESALALGDGLITLAQLMSPGWRMPDLIEVFLSCCETALGKATLTDDILTLSAGFLCAGARTVISTLWSVDQLATAIFCIRYYHHRHPNPDTWCDRPTALHLAQQDLRTLPGSALADPAQFKPLMDLYQQHLAEEYPRLLAQSADLKIQEEQAKQRGDKARARDLRNQRCALDVKAQQNKRLQKYLPTLSQSPAPFASPFYWAAFTCQGLR